MTVTINGTSGITTPGLNNSGPLSGTTGTFSGIISANGGGITFPTTQNASSDANTLDDYEEGTWTPTLITDMGGTTSYTTQYGKYTKIGNVVYVEAGIVWTAFSGSGNVQIGGFPFPVVFSNPAKAISILLSASTNTGLVNYSLSDYRTSGSYSALYMYSFGGVPTPAGGVGASGTICFKGYYFI